MVDSSIAPMCPYAGMSPFRAEQSDLFFGRDCEIHMALQQLRLYPFLAVIGPSGSGKSSVVSAGIVPAMRRSRFFGYDNLHVRMMRPGNEPLSSLAATFGVSEALRDAIVAQAKQIAGEAPLLLILDQFDETFTVAPADQSKAFQETVGRLIGIANLYIILSVRADFYPNLMNSPLWGEISGHRLEVTTLHPDELRAAIVKPAEAVGASIESTLVERLVADAGREPGVLPFVQETLIILWVTASDHQLTLASYEHLAANVTGASGLLIAMARHADASYYELPLEGQQIARRTFLRLMQFGEGRPDTRRRQPASELRAVGDDPAVFDATLQRLVGCRLLVTDIDPMGAAPTVDLAHEALITGWPRLRSWIEDRRETERMRRGLEAKAQEWTRLGCGDGGLLDPVEIKEVESWLKQDNFAALDMTAEMMKFVNQSRKHADSLANILTERLKLLLFAREQKELQEIESKLVKAEAQRERAEQTIQALQADKDHLEGIIAQRSLAFQDSEYREAVVHIERLEVKRLKKEERAEFESALEQAFTLNTLHEMITKKLEQNPEIVLNPGNLRMAVTQVVDWATRNGALPNLIIGAFESVPGNPNLRAFAINFRPGRRK